MSRLIDADALVAKMNLAIAMLKCTMKNFDIEDDPECQMELKAYQDIRDGIKEEQTIYPETEEEAYERGYTAGQMAERKTGEWTEKSVITKDEAEKCIEEWQTARCKACGLYHTTPYMYHFRNYNFCPNCGSYNGGEQE